ncbi:MAG: hypothetical protein PHG41_04560 [Actinomycetota bacterium]|nr:hypothetical protein [Actinomycetota bacterium]
MCIALCSCTAFQNVKEFFKGKFSVETEINRAIETVDIFFNLLIDKNYNEAYEYLSSRDKERHSLDDFYNEFRNVTEIVSIDIKWGEVKNNIAVVGIDLTDFYDGEEKVYADVEVSLVKEEDGSWKIVFWK